jgi:hypothetical protein
MAGFRDAVGRCFTLGEDLFEEYLDAHPNRPTYDAPTYNVLDDLVMSGASFDPPTTVSKVGQIRNIALKAYLLQSLARALYAVQKPEALPKKASQPTHAADQPPVVSKTP